LELLYCFSSITPRLLISTLFPYTTLFRSFRNTIGRVCGIVVFQNRARLFSKFIAKRAGVLNVSNYLLRGCNWTHSVIFYIFFPVYKEKFKKLCNKKK